MLYLEDFLEVIELIPQEIRDRTTDLRELDLGIQNTSDQLEEQIKTFFGNAKKMKQQERDAEYEKIRKEYYKLLVDADEKVNIATNMHDLLERYCRKLDQELEKFKLELEADSPGITEMLEKRSLELDEPTRDSQKENRCVSMGVRSSSGERRQTSAATNNVKKEERVEPHPTSSLSLSPPSSTISYTLGHMGAGSNAIAAAASQAIAATQQMQQGRRTASLKASFDAVTLGVHPTEFSIGSELANAAQTALAASALPQEPVTTSTSTSSNKRQKKKHPASTSSSSGGGGGGGSGGVIGGSAGGGSSSSAAIPIPAVMENSPVPSEDFLADSLIDPNSENPDWTYDPNEPRYCVCNQVSYGDMVACDNPKCPLEWFHYPCVGITAPPKGKWYCPQCASSMNRRSRK